MSRAAFAREEKTRAFRLAEIAKLETFINTLETFTLAAKLEMEAHKVLLNAGANPVSTYANALRRDFVNADSVGEIYYPQTASLPNTPQKRMIHRFSPAVRNMIRQSFASVQSASRKKRKVNLLQGTSGN